MRFGLQDRRLARVVRRCRELPGQRLFQYLDDDGKAQVINSDDVNGYLRDVLGQEFSAKDFRTWAGTVLAAEALLVERERTDTHLRDTLGAAIKEVAAKLGNTPAVCRRCYIHPAVIEAHLNDDLSRAVQQSAARGPARPRRGLRHAERLVLEVLRAQLSAQRRQTAADAA